jgi:hypothetical protein
VDAPRSRPDHELWPPSQTGVLLALWAAWGAVATYVVCRERTLHEQGRYYDDSAWVYSLLLFWLPLPLVVLGGIYLRRLRAEVGLLRRAAYLVVVFLTFAGALVLAAGTFACMALPGKIRE